MPGENEVSHEDLASAQDDALDDPTAEATQGGDAEEVTDTQEDTTDSGEVEQETQDVDGNVVEDPIEVEKKALQDERSNIGRRMKALEGDSQAFQSKVLEALERIGKPATQTDEAQVEIDPYDPDSIGQLIDQRVEQREALQKQTQSAYDTNARSHMIHNMGKDYSDEEWGTISADAEANWNCLDLNNPVGDAEANFLAAENRYLRGKLTTKENPFKKNDGKTTEGLGSATKSSPSDVKTSSVQLPADAQELARDLNMTQEDIDKTFGKGA